MNGLLGIAAVAAGSVLLTFMASLLEASLYSVGKARVETLERSGDRRGKVLARQRANIDEAIATILIMNTVASIVGASVLGALVSERFGSRALGAVSAAFTVVVLLFAEIMPKSLGVRYAAVLAPNLAIPLQIVIWALKPATKVCAIFTRLWGRDAHISHGTAEDIISLAQLVARHGEIHPHEVDWVANALRLDEVTAYDLMTPNPVVARVPVNMKLSETKITADHWRFSRLPVCSGRNPDEILGVVQRRKVFDALAQDKFGLTMGDLMAKPEFVAEGLPAHQLLDQFLNKRQHLFCVQDENGLFTGVVSLEDVLEELLGREIVDETDLHEDMQQVALRRKSALLSGRRGAPTGKR